MLAWGAGEELLPVVQGGLEHNVPNVAGGIEYAALYHLDWKLLQVGAVGEQLDGVRPQSGSLLGQQLWEDGRLENDELRLW